jgi:uncharacterized protein (TIGR02001 family)
MKKLHLVSVAAGLVLASPLAYSAVEYSADVSSDYLWRGTSLSGGNAAASAAIDYSHDSGVYVGLWTSSAAGAAETDIYAGWASSLGGVDLDVGLINYAYPQSGGTELNEFYVSLGMSGASVSFYQNLDSEDVVNGQTYISLGYGVGKYSISYGMATYEETVEANDYSHVDLGYAATDNLSFTVSLEVSDEDEADVDRPYVSATYSF